jgi:hypothetical protein
MSTSVPSPVFGPNGFSAPSDPAILAGVIADWNAALGGNVNPALNTPQGQLASSETAIISEGYALFLQYVNYVDPAFSAGRMQDAIGRIYFLERLPAQATVTDVSGAVCTGAVGTFINTGAQAVDANGNVYICTAGAAIPFSGSIALPFACTVTGPIVLGANQLTTIYSTIPGWDTITNPDPGITGSNVETAADFEARRAASVAANSRNTNYAVLGAVLAVTDVLDAYVIDNPTNAPVTIGGVSVDANTLYVCAAGGDEQAVANAIWTKKPPGIPTQGGVTKTVVDNNSGYDLPYPTYTINYTLPTSLAIYFLVQLKNLSEVPANALQLIQQAIGNAFTGADNGTRARIGSTLFAGRYYAGVVNLGSWAQVLSITMGSDQTLAASVTATIAGTVMTVSAVGSGALAVGQFLEGVGIASGTYIASLGSGTGGTGTYNLSQSNTVGSGETVSAIAPSLDQITADINQIPVYVPANVQLVLV